MYRTLQYVHVNAISGYSRYARFVSRLNIKGFANMLQFLIAKIVPGCQNLRFQVLKINFELVSLGFKVLGYFMNAY